MNEGNENLRRGAPPSAFAVRFPISLVAEAASAFVALLSAKAAREQLLALQERQVRAAVETAEEEFIEKFLFPESTGVSANAELSPREATASFCEKEQSFLLTLLLPVDAAAAEAVASPTRLLEISAALASAAQRRDEGLPKKEDSRASSSESSSDSSESSSADSGESGESHSERENKRASPATTSSPSGSARSSDSEKAKGKTLLLVKVGESSSEAESESEGEREGNHSSSPLPRSKADEGREKKTDSGEEEAGKRSLKRETQKQLQKASNSEGESESEDELVL